MSDPVLVVYTSLGCKHCTQLKSIWDKELLPSLKETQSNLRFVMVTARNNSGVFNENIFPKKLLDYARWFPMILLVPGQVWDTAMQTMNSSNPSEIREGVQIMNGVRNDGSIQYVFKYNALKSHDFVKWLKEAMETEEFKKVQTQVKKSVPKPEPKSIPSLINVPNKPLTPINTPDTTSFPNLAPVTSDVCSMRIISRRK